MSIRIFVLLAGMILAKAAAAFVDIKNGVFCINEVPTTFVGINIEQAHITPTTLQTIKAMGFNALRIKIKDASLLKSVLDEAKKYQLQVLVAIDFQADATFVESYVHEQSILAWEVLSLEQAALFNKADNNHLICIAAPEDKVITPSPLRSRHERSQHTDFLTLQLRPLDYGWVAPSSLFQGLQSAYFKTNTYITELYRTASFNGKPLVVTACSYPRDKMFRYENSPTLNRNSYLSAVFSKMKSTGEAPPALAACFLSQWAEPTEINDSTQRNIAVSAIYASDTTTIKLIQTNFPTTK